MTAGSITGPRGSGHASRLADYSDHFGVLAIFDIFREIWSSQRMRVCSVEWLAAENVRAGVRHVIITPYVRT